MSDANSDQILRYVRHADIADYKAAGWQVMSDMADCHHGVYSVLMGASDDFPPCRERLERPGDDEAAKFDEVTG